MLDHKHFPKFILLLTLTALIAVFALLLTYDGADAGADTGITMDYETALFDPSQILDVSIEMDEDQWQDLLDNALSEEYYPCDVTVNGETYKNVGIRAKGNTSLSMVAASDSDRYSFKISFDQYVDGQTCCGLSALILNNNYSDATMMREALCYDMFQFLGADSSLYNYAKFSVNGSYTGLYLALEPVDDDFLLRNYGLQDGELYKPDSEQMGGPGKMQDFDPDEIRQRFETDEDANAAPSSNSDANGGFSTEPSDGNASADFSSSDEPTAGDVPAGKGSAPYQAPNTEPLTGEDTQNNASPGSEGSMPDGAAPGGAPDGMPGDGPKGKGEFGGRSDAGGGDFGKNGNFGGDGSSGSGAALNYTDDDSDSYSAIWEGEVSGTSDADHAWVIKALKAVASSGSEEVDMETLSKYLDIDNILKYMAVHTFVVNLDSLSGNMAHNYYLYESDGQLNLLPWDYNLAFGGFQGGDASSVINFAIDTPFSSNVSLEDRTFFMNILRNEECLETYHQYLNQLVTEYVSGGKLEETYQRIRTQIDELVKTDPTAFYTYEEYDDAAAMLLETIFLRGESVAGQLAGTIPSTNEGQAADSGSLTDASSIDLSVMGTMGGGRGGMDMNRSNDNGRPNDTSGRDGVIDDSRGAIEPGDSNPGGGFNGDPGSDPNGDPGSDPNDGSDGGPSGDPVDGSNGDSSGGSNGKSDRGPGFSDGAQEFPSSDHTAALR